MSKIKGVLAGLLSLIGFLFLFPAKALAVCPVCTVAVGAGLGISRYLGIDDSVTGVWIGGIILSSSFWFSNWLTKKFPKKKIPAWAVILTMYAFVLIPLQLAGNFSHPANTLYGIDKLLLGITKGSIVFLLGMYLDRKVREVKGKQLFNYQKVGFPVAGLVITSLIFYFITR